jgi:hypothetical protein
VEREGALWHTGSTDRRSIKGANSSIVSQWFGTMLVAVLMIVKQPRAASKRRVFRRKTAVSINRSENAVG